MFHPIQRPAPASANLCPLRLCLRAILLLTLFVVRLQAQGSSSGANLGVAFPKDTIALETTFRLACSIGHTGVCLDGALGFDWGRPFTAVYDLADLDIGLAVARGAERPTALLLRGGVSSWTRNDHTSEGGVNAGIAVRHLMRSGVGWRVDYNWRHFPKFMWPSLTFGLESGEWLD